MRNAVWIALIALILATGWHLWSNLESYETTIDSGYSSAARRDPLLALARLLQRDEIDVRRADSASRLGDLSTTGTLIVTDAHYLYTPRQIERVLAWVEQGGHLIVASGDEESELLTRFGVGLASETDEDAAEQMAEALEKMARANGEALPEALQKPPLELHFEGAEGAVTVDLCSSCRALTYNEGEAENDEQSDEPVPFYGAGLDERTHFLQFEHGDGIVSVITELDFWHNDAIGEHDHAYLAQLLAGNSGDVVLLSAARTAPLTTLIWRAAPELVTGLALLLALWLWHRTSRFGPLREAQQVPRRALAEHLLASARYRWQQRQISALLQPLRNELRARRTHASRSDNADTLSPAQLHNALEQIPSSDPEQLRTIVTDLQTLDRTLR